MNFKLPPGWILGRGKERGKRREARGKERAGKMKEKDKETKGREGGGRERE